MSFEFKLPDLGEGLTEGEIGRWLVAEGQEIREDDPLVEISTDKTSVEIASPTGGIVSEILAREGEVVPVGTVIVVIADGSKPSLRKHEARGLSGRDDDQQGRIRATPLVRRIAQELSVDVAHIRGTGADGQITEHDVRRAADSPESEERRVPLRGVRRNIAEHLATSHREIPAVTFVEECDFSGIELSRIVALVVKTAATTLKEFPELNARLEGSELVYLRRVNIGVAVQTNDGLIVPVIKDCDEKSVDEIETQVLSLAERARARSLASSDLRGSTFTVSNGGRLGGLLATPLINHPEVGILGLHRIAPRAVVDGADVVVRPIGNLSLTFDHRVVDGMRAASFVAAIIGRLRVFSAV